MTSQTETDAVRVSVRGFPWFIVNSICGLVFLFFAFGDVSWTSFERALSGSADFTIFYTAARLVREYPPSKLYDLETQSHVQREVLGAYILPRGFLPYNHPPFEMLLFLPMGYLSYSVAFLVWLGVNLCFICLPALDTCQGCRWSSGQAQGDSAFGRALFFSILCVFDPGAGFDSISMVCTLGLLIDEEGQQIPVRSVARVGLFQIPCRYFFGPPLDPEEKNSRTIGGHLVFRRADSMVDTLDWNLSNEGLL